MIYSNCDPFPLRLSISIELVSVQTVGSEEFACLYIGRKRKMRKWKPFRKVEIFMKIPRALKKKKTIVNNLCESSNFSVSCFSRNILRWGSWTFRIRWHTLSFFLTPLSKPRVFQGYCSLVRLHTRGIMIQRHEHYNWSLGSSPDLVQQCDLGHFLNSYTLFNSLKLPKISTTRDYRILCLTWIHKSKLII